MRKAFWLLFALALPALAQDPVLPAVTAIHTAPTLGELPPPESLRPCCAFGYDLHVRAAGIPIPMYQIGNVLTLGTLGQAGRIFYSEELGVRRVQLNAFTPPAGVRQRYQLAAWLAGHLAFEIAQWHEIAQWYGFQSVPGFSEEISAFSPEDLYSNLLGARLAINIILSGHGGSLEDYNQAMDAALKQVLTRLLVATRGETEAMFQQIDGDWWNSHRRVPDKFLVLKRNYDLQENRLPTPVPFETMPPYRLTMPEQVGGFRLRDLGELQIYPGHDMQALPVPAQYYGAGAFQGLADRAHEADKTQLARTEK
ncbi:TPA: DUF4056 domain-containing protein [Klebsiella pneumoniae]|uniref:DUF4056 domain-containing protein n=1 Tax=Klebsiella sp. GG_Kp139 TaxID=3153450 RepID=UPI0032B47431|nr:DUF4056 domain-containing protein [Klebsiella pneumoniae]